MCHVKNYSELKFALTWSLLQWKIPDEAAVPHILVSCCLCEDFPSDKTKPYRRENNSQITDEK